MVKKPTKLDGLNIDKFEALLHSGEEINLQSARLIPFYKPGDEMSLVSIFLSGLRLVKEFRDNISKAVNLSKAGKMHVFTEVEFRLFDKKRIDGLIIIVRGNKIIDSALLEMKNKNSELDEVQISNYLQIAKEYKIPKLITVTNQFVSNPSQSPITVKVPKYVNMYHLSWSYILTVGNLLLFKNQQNIEDEDQVEIMHEILNYFENDKSGVLGFTQMKQGWSEIVNKINVGTSINIKDPALDDTISSWLEEERDMSLILSRQLGTLVDSSKRQFKDDLIKRTEYEKRELIKNNSLDSILRIDGAVSDIIVTPHIDRKNIQMSVSLNAPTDRSTRSQITWVKNQLNYLEKKNPELFASIKKEVIIEIILKFTSAPVQVGVDDLDEVWYDLKDKQIKSFNISQIRYLGKKFENRKRFVTEIEDMLCSYYEIVVENLKQWVKPPPKIVKEAEIKINVPDAKMKNISKKEVVSEEDSAPSMPKRKGLGRFFNR